MEAIFGFDISDSEMAFVWNEMEGNCTIIVILKLIIYILQKNRYAMYYACVSKEW